MKSRAEAKANIRQSTTALLSPALNNPDENQINAIQQLTEDAKVMHAQVEKTGNYLKYGAPFYAYGMLGGAEITALRYAPSVLFGTTAALSGTAVSAAVVAGGLYGFYYNLSTKEKNLVVQRLILEINATQDVGEFFNKAEAIVASHAPYLRNERGFYGLALVQSWIGNKYGHEQGQTTSWIAITNALKSKCSELANAEHDEEASARLDALLAKPIEQKCKMSA